MELRQLGNSDLRITPIGIGAWAIGGGGWDGSMGPQNDSDSIPAIHAALDHGMNWIDTAALYGLGHSEEMVARALDGRTPRPYIFTKCERVWDEKGKIGASLKAASIRRECEASLRRLKTDVIDLYQIHWPEPDHLVEAAWTMMAKLQKQGKVRHIGVSNFNVDQMRRAQAIRAVEKEHGTRVITMIHRQERRSLFGFAVSRHIDLEDAQTVIAAIKDTPDDTPIDLIIHTPGGIVLAAMQIARAVEAHPAKVTAYVPVYAMSGGTLIAPAAVRHGRVLCPWPDRSANSGPSSCKYR